MYTYECILSTLSRGLSRGQPALNAKITFKTGFDPGTRRDAKHLDTEITKWAKVIKDSSVRSEQ